jgi:exosortase family protein XrtF
MFFYFYTNVLLPFVTLSINLKKNYILISILKEYKPFLLFLAKFFLSYLVLTMVYNFYLSHFDADKFETDGFTNLVSRQVVQTLHFVDDEVFSEPNLTEASVNVFYKQKWVARIIEGCNALSVIILFVSFVVAFSGKWKPTVVFILVGIALVHVFNVVRIATLCMAIYHLPAYSKFLHDVMFPLVIYGLVFILWIVWVNKFSFYAEK